MPAGAVIMRSMDADELYTVPLARFVPERTALVKALRAAGEKDAAKDAAALRKPSVAAWAVNQIVRSESKAMKELLRAGDALRTAQEEVFGGGGAPDELRSALERERAAVDALRDAAADVLRSAGAEPSATVLERVSDTLHAAALDDGARESVTEGRLTSELRHVGFGLGEGPPAPATSAGRGASASPSAAPAPKRPRAAGAKRGRGGGGRKRDEPEPEPAGRDAKTRAREEKAERAAEAKQAREDEKRAREEEKDRAVARRELRAAERTLRDAERAAARATERREQASEALAERTQAAEAAEAARREAEDAHRSAGAHLTELGG